MTGRKAEEIANKVLALDQRAWSDVQDAREDLVSLGQDVLPVALDVWPRLKGWRARSAVLHTALKFALVSPAARQLAPQALADPSGRVRHVALMLISVTEDPDMEERVIPLMTHPDSETRADAQAALDAVRRRNRHLFLDRDHTNRVSMQIGGLIRPAEDG